MLMLSLLEIDLKGKGSGTIFSLGEILNSVDRGFFMLYSVFQTMGEMFCQHVFPFRQLGRRATLAFFLCVEWQTSFF